MEKLSSESDSGAGFLASKVQLRTLLIFAIIGVAAGIFILYPTNEFVYFYEHRPSQSTPVAFAVSQIQQSLRGGTPKKTAFYGIVGLVLSISAAGLFRPCIAARSGLSS